MLGKLINTCHVYTVRMSPALNISSALQLFERSNAIEIRNGIMFDFYPGLPHMHHSASYTCSLFYPVRHSSNLDNVVPKMGSSWNYLAFTCWVTEKDPENISH